MVQEESKSCSCTVRRFFFSYPCRCIQGNLLWILLIVPSILCICGNYNPKKSVGKYVDEGGALKDQDISLGMLKDAMYRACTIRGLSYVTN